MRIGIESQRLFRPQKFGMDIVGLELIKNLMIIDDKNEYFIFVKPDKDSACLPEKANFNIVEIDAPGYAIWEQFALPKAVRDFNIDILHCTCNTAPLFVSVPVVLTLHDIIFLEQNSLFQHSGTLYQRFGNFYRKLLVPLVFRKCASVVTVSEYEKKVIDAFFGKNTGVKVIYNGVSDYFFPGKNEVGFDVFSKKIKLPFEYLLFIGNTAIKKNTKNVVRGFSEYALRVGKPLKLVLVNFSEHDLHKLLSEIDKPQIFNEIVLTGYLKPQELAMVMRNATVFLVPSLRESFGIPVLEGMLSGVPVITSNSSSMPEIAGDAAVLVNPYDYLEISLSIEKLVNDDVLRTDMIAKGLKRAGEFSWKKMAVEYLDLYTKTYNSKNIDS